MSHSIEDFLQKIMNINVMSMGGAMAGIIGSSGAGADVVYNLKRTSVEFAGEYRKAHSNQSKLNKFEQKIVGQLRTLQLTCTLSENTVNMLIDELQLLSAN
jgi:hypothetical protein